MAAERVILVGAGDHGRGVLEIFRRAAEAGREVEIVGFVDDDPGAGPVDGIPLLGTSAWLREHADSLEESVLLSMADSAAKRRVATALAGRVRWTSVVHPRAEVYRSASLGEGSVVSAGAIVAYEARIGAHVTVNLGATIGHHVAIGDYTTIAPGANVLGRVAIGEGVQIHANAVVLPSVVIGDAAIVGAGSVVLRDVAPGAKVFGNPARIVPGP
jgi:sugar O-acyltransferase (sialic acid O-acetyltransferase NeuD family)